MRDRRLQEVEAIVWGRQRVLAKAMMITSSVALSTVERASFHDAADDAPSTPGTKQGALTAVPQLTHATLKDRGMTVATTTRAAWLAGNVLTHEPELRAWLARRQFSGLSIDDVVQESYAILAALASVEHIRNPRTYFFEVAKSVIRQSLRRAPLVPIGTVADFAALDLPDEAPGPERSAAARHELGRLAELAAALPPKCREAFLLRKVRGMSQRDVANAMRISENTVEKHVGKALALLTAAMGRGGTGERLASNGDERSPSSRPTIRWRQRLRR